MRLINADALIKSIKECVEAKDANCEWEQVQGLECALECSDEEPTVQPVVRCKDCVYWSSKKTRYCNMLKGTFQENDYCSYAERRTDE